eukprot:gene7392-9576_t
MWTDVLHQAAQNPQMRRWVTPILLHMAEVGILGGKEYATREHCEALVDTCGCGLMLYLPKGLAGKLPQSLAAIAVKGRLGTLLTTSAMDFTMSATHRGGTVQYLLRPTKDQGGVGAAVNMDGPSIIVHDGAEEQPCLKISSPLPADAVVLRLYFDSLQSHTQNGGYVTRDRSVAVSVLRGEAKQLFEERA